MAIQMIRPRWRRFFLFPVAGLLVCLVGLNAAVRFATRNSVPRRLMQHARESQSASVLALGNSLIGAGFSENSFDAGMGLNQASASVNLALGASSPVEQLLLLRYALQHGMHPRTVVYGFYDFQLTEPVALSTRDMIGNRAILYYVEPEYGRNFYELSLHDRIEFEIGRHFELFEDRGAVWGRVERFRRVLEQVGIPPVETNSMGRVSDFALLAFPSTDAFTSECNRQISADLDSAVRQIIVQSEAAGSRVYFVEMPMPRAHVHAFYDTDAWAGYRAHVVSILDNLNVSFIDASGWIDNKSDFADPLHLNSAGASRFSQRLGEQLSPTSATSKSVGGL